MKGKVYYLGKDDKIYTGRDIALSAKLVHNMNLKTKEDLDEYVKLRCAGIIKELKNVSVKDLVAKDEITKAIILYKELRHCTLKEAEEYVQALEESIREKK